MKQNCDPQAKHFPHWCVLAFVALLAVALWYWWLVAGMGWVHGKVTDGVSKHVAAIASQTPATHMAASAADPSQPVDERTRVFTELGQTGDSFGGLNALLTAIAGALVAWAGFMQHQTLKQARNEAKAERDSRKVQQFESLFFQLLQLSAAVTERIEGPQPKAKEMERRKGSRALDAYAQKIFQGLPPRRDQGADQQRLDALVRNFLTIVYERMPSTIGPYFRLLYQTFKHVHESSLALDDQMRYANIARGQISEGAVLLLAINGLTSHGYKLVPLIEKFGLLEHLHPRYRDEIGPALMLGYRPRAFMGSEERAKPGNEWEDTPKLAQAKFQNLERNSHTEANAQMNIDAGFDPEAEQEG